MKLFISALVFLILSLTPAVNAQATFKYVGPGCGPTVGYPWERSGVLWFYGSDQFALSWPCERGTGSVVGRFYIVLSAPSSARVQLYSPIVNCFLRGTGVIVLPSFDLSRHNAGAQLGTIPSGVDFYIQGVFMLYPTGKNGFRCPNHLTLTPTWRVKR